MKFKKLDKIFLKRMKEEREMKKLLNYFLSLLYKYNIAQNQSFVQKGIGVKI